MIHNGSENRHVMATFVITTPKKDGRRKKKRQARDNKNRTNGNKLTKNRERRIWARKKKPRDHWKIKEKNWSRKWEIESNQTTNRSKKKQQHKQKVWKQKREANEANGELSETDLKSDEETVRRWRTSWTLHANGRGNKFCRVTCWTFDMAKKEKTHLAVKKRSWWNTIDRKQMKQQQQKKTRIQWSDFKGRCGKLEDLSRKEAFPTARHTTMERPERTNTKMHQRQEKSKKTRDSTNTRRLQRNQEHSRNQICNKKSTHHQEEEREMWSHCNKEGSCQCLWWSLQKTIRWQRTRRKWTGTLREWDWKQHQWAKQRYEWDEKNSRDHDWRITDCNKQTKKSAKESEPKTSKLATKRRKRWWGRSSTS